MSRIATIGMLPVVLLTACADTSFDEYYPAGMAGGPEIQAVEPEFEVGNLGGQEVTISGSNFGESPLVMIANHNVEVLSISDSEIVVTSPVGPITGGKSSVLVATENGFDEWGLDRFGELDESESGYTYDMEPILGIKENPEDADDLTYNPYERQNSYILVQNFWNSCYGGRSPTSIPNAGCEQIAYVGQSGIEGQAEFFRFQYERVHTANLGFVTGFDAAPQWKVLSGGAAATPFPSGIDDLRERLSTSSLNPNAISSFKLKNPALSAEPDQCLIFEGGNVVADPSCGSDSREYRVDEMQFCEGEDPDNGPDFTYRADYPVLFDFFSNPLDPSSAVSVTIEADDPRLDGVLLNFPPPLIVDGIAGVDPDDDDNVWMVSGELSACPDTDGDGQALLDEAGLIVGWDPIPDVVSEDDPTAITGECGEHDCDIETSSYVHISVSYLNMGWFGGEGAGIRASVVVPDAAGEAEIPNSVLMQFPTPNQQWSEENEFSSEGTLGTFESNASFMVLEFTRVTDYRIEDLETGDVTVFAYATGDMSFMDWKNPIEAENDCSDCLDGDGDGYADAHDPDCNEDVGGNGITEDDSNTDFTCSDGIDNDGDGLIDAEDTEQCVNGWDGETNCGDGIDNDGDGWIDGLDGECPDDDPLASEAGDDFGDSLCNDGIDNDGDGWIDAADPGCVDGSDNDEGGFDSTLPCNDGIEDPNDADELADADDPYCALEGALATSEEPAYFTRCADNMDNDGDTFFDAYDPDCEYGFHGAEDNDFMDPTDTAADWFGTYITQCYDGLDNDGDGVADGEDPGCWSPMLDFWGNGWIDDEATIHQFPSGHPDEGTDTPCSDGIDNDADGWVDGLDPDCNPGEATGDGQKEVGFGTSVCNDGIDNNGDTLIDAESTEWCDNGRDTFEGP